MNLLQQYGANERFLAEATLYPAWNLARVLSQYNELYKIVTAQGEGLAEVSGKFRHAAAGLADYPAVGDFVMVDRADTQNGHAIIHQVLRRKSLFERAAAGAGRQTQVVAANMDIVLLCMALNHDYNLNRLERYLALAWSSGATPVVVLTKADLRDDLPALLAEIGDIAIGVDILATSSFDPASYEQLLAYLRPGITATLLGSSGVGKSTLINRLAGQELLATAATGADDKGRHTTTRRDLLLLPQGGLVIDTPGMRELGMEAPDLGQSFVDIDELARDCRFADCTHGNEPGCAVQAALQAGLIDERRLENYHKLQKEARYDGLTARQIENDKINSMFGGLGEMKQARDYFKKKNS